MCLEQELQIDSLNKTETKNNDVGIFCDTNINS